MVLPVEQVWHDILTDMTKVTDSLTEEDVKDELSTVSSLLKNDTIQLILEGWSIFLGRAKCNEIMLLEDAEKSEVRAFHYRTLGNSAITVRDYHTAIHLYNKSIMFSTKHSENFQFGLSNRAIALYKVGYVEGAMKDLIMAMSTNFPPEKYYKLFYRLAQCYYSIGDALEGTMNSKMSIYELVNNSNLPSRNIRAMRRKIEKMMDTLVILKKPKVEFVDESENTVIQEHPEYQGMSQDLEVIKKEGKGRSVIVKTYIRKNEVLFKEAPYVSLPIDTGEVHTCDYCSTAIKQQVPCDYCAKSHYCNENCRVIAERRYHQYECLGLKLGLWEFTGIARLALRVFLSGLQNGFDLGDLSMITTAKELIDKLDKDLTKPDYERVYNLVTNMGKMEKADLKTYALVAILLSCYIRTICDNPINVLSEADISLSVLELDKFMSAMILKHICQMICNSTVITRMADPLSLSGNTLSEEPVASAVYPSVSMMNHSCVPNTKISYEDNHIVVKATKDMTRGTEVFNCYGLRYGVQSKEERQTVLKLQYGFQCDCVGCEEP